MQSSKWSNLSETSITATHWFNVNNFQHQLSPRQTSRVARPDCPARQISRHPGSPAGSSVTVYVQRRFSMKNPLQCNAFPVRGWVSRLVCRVLHVSLHNWLHTVVWNSSPYTFSAVNHKQKAYCYRCWSGPTSAWAQCAATKMLRPILARCCSWNKCCQRSTWQHDQLYADSKKDTQTQHNCVIIRYMDHLAKSSRTSVVHLQSRSALGPSCIVDN